jgi:hypothetical protein
MRLNEKQRAKWLEMGGSRWIRRILNEMLAKKSKLDKRTKGMT